MALKLRYVGEERVRQRGCIPWVSIEFSMDHYDVLKAKALEVKVQASYDPKSL